MSTRAPGRAEEGLPVAGTVFNPSIPHSAVGANLALALSNPSIPCIRCSPLLLAYQRIRRRVGTLSENLQQRSRHARHDLLRLRLAVPADLLRLAPVLVRDQVPQPRQVAVVEAELRR